MSPLSNWFPKATAPVRAIVSLALVTLSLALFLQTLKAGDNQVTGAANGIGYGFNVSDWDVSLMQSMGFNWIKIFNNPGSRLPVNVLVRVEANTSHLGNLAGFGNDLYQRALSQKGYIDAYEIGNEPNLDAGYGWAAAPVAADYVTLLCQAYDKIKEADPDALVISAGLAPTGRVQGNWNGHAGHTGGYQDEREYFKEFLAAGGAACLDAVGYHPYGFSADFDAVPDVPSGDSRQNCANGFCFRGAEKIYELMQARGHGDKKVWATEFGWIVTPPQKCLNDPSWQGRLWQIVSEQKQATNLVGAFQYAAANWPWMEAMFIFNLNFNTSPFYSECEQMRYYGVEGRPAESALRDMPKVTDPPQAELAASHSTLSAMITPGQQPFSLSTPVRLSNVGDLTFTYTVTVQAGSLTPTVNSSGGSLGPGEQSNVSVDITSTGRPVGAYTATIVIEATTGTIGAPVNIPATLFIVDGIQAAYLPLIQRHD